MSRGRGSESIHPVYKRQDMSHNAGPVDRAGRRAAVLAPAQGSRSSPLPGEYSPHPDFAPRQKGRLAALVEPLSAGQSLLSLGSGSAGAQ